jgi:hypothetical protein
MESMYRQFQEDSEGHDNGNENSNPQTIKKFAAWVEAEAASRHECTSSQVNTPIYLFKLTAPEYNHHENESNMLFLCRLLKLLKLFLI